MLGLDKINTTKKTKTASPTNVWDELTAFEQDVRNETIDMMTRNLLVAANKSENRDQILDFLSGNPKIAQILGDDASQYSKRIDELTSMEGLAADIKAAKGAKRAIIGATVGYSMIHTILHGGGVISAILSIPGGLLLGFAFFAVAVGIGSVIHLIVVRLGRYVKKLKEIKEKGLDSAKFSDGKKYQSDYLPKYENWGRRVTRINNLQKLCSEIIQNPEKGNAATIAEKFSAMGIIFEDGKVKAGSHYDKQSPSMSVETKGWDEKKLTMAVDASLKLVENLMKTVGSKDQAIKAKLLGKEEKKLLKAAFKELNFWVLDLVRGVAVAAEKYSNR